LPGVQIKGQDLEDAIFIHTCLANADLSSTNLKRALMTGADLCGSNLYQTDFTEAGLQRVNLHYAHLDRTNLTNADLCNANIENAGLTNSIITMGCRLPSGHSWETYLTTIVPALLKAGGRTINEILDLGAWNCHDWANCPAAVAFGVNQLSRIPLLYQKMVQEFILFFDAGLIPEPKREGA
jgi:hypothetical protein